MQTLSVIIGKTQFYISRICYPCTYIIKRGNSAKKSTDNKNGYFEQSFRQLFGKYLCLTNTIASAALMGLADLMQQEVENYNAGKPRHIYDWNRNIHMSEIGAVQGYLSHCFYMLLDKYMPGTQLKTIAKKLVIDQGIFAPFCICFFFIGMQYLSRNDWESSINELREKFIFVYMVDCVVWIPTQFINFYLLHPRFRVLYLSFISVLYNMFLSFVKHNNIAY